jgi:hypothetical protein
VPSYSVQITFTRRRALRVLVQKSNSEIDLPFIDYVLNEAVYSDKCHKAAIIKSAVVCETKSIGRRLRRCACCDALIDSLWNSKRRL